MAAVWEMRPAMPPRFCWIDRSCTRHPRFCAVLGILVNDFPVREINQADGELHTVAHGHKGRQIRVILVSTSRVSI